MKRFFIASAMSLCAVSLAVTVSADTLIMRDGTRVQGIVVGIAGRTITFRHADGATRRYPTSEVEALEFTSADRVNPRAASDHRLEAPAGAQLVVRTIERIDSRNVGADQTFSAIVEEEVTNGSGQVIIPERSSAQLIIRQISSGSATGIPEMMLDIQSISVDGRRFLATGGSNGAAIGVLVGAAGGAGVQMLTRGRDVQVPAEMILTFRLDKAVTLQAER